MKSSRPKSPIKLANEYLAIVYCHRSGHHICDGIQIAGKAKQTVRMINATPGQPAGFRARTMPIEIVFHGNGVGVYDHPQLPL
jgi:hypothetical protein